jgi:hypothetical protein
MNERMRRHWAACEAMTLPRGGVTLVAQATGLSRTTIWAGLRELRHPEDLPDDDLPWERSRHAGAGRPFLEKADPTLVRDLEALVEATTRGDPQSPLRWTCQSTRNLAEELNRQGHRVRYRTVAAILHDLDYSLQANRKTREGSSHPDRDAQFEYSNRQVCAFQRAGQPAVSVDSKKRELVGDFKNTGQEWRPAGCPEEVRAKDFPDQRLGKVTPSGVYDLTYNEGWVSVGIDHNTSQFAVETIRRWYATMSRPTYPAEATRLLISTDEGGSNGSRNPARKMQLAALAAETGLEITVCYFPPGTSKWNRIEHRPFSSPKVRLTGATTTRTGLKVRAQWDFGLYPTKTGMSDEDLAAVPLHRHPFHGEWNYTVRRE